MGLCWIAKVFGFLPPQMLSTRDVPHEVEERAESHRKREGFSVFCDPTCEDLLNRSIVKAGSNGYDMLPSESITTYQTYP